MSLLPVPDGGGACHYVNCRWVVDCVSDVLLLFLVGMLESYGSEKLSLPVGDLVILSPSTFSPKPPVGIVLLSL